MGRKALLLTLTVIAIVALAATAYASLGVTGDNATNGNGASSYPSSIANLYHVGDNIYYAETVRNPASTGIDVRFNDVKLLGPDRVTSIPITSTIDLPAGGEHTWTFLDVPALAWPISGTEPDQVGTHPYGGKRITSTLLADAVGLDQIGDTGAVNVNASSWVISPAITIDKTVDFDKDGQFSDLETSAKGCPAVWKIVVHNSGDTELKITGLDDDSSENLLAAFVAKNGDDLLGVGESVEITYTTYPDASLTNTATVEGKDAIALAGGTGGVVTDKDDASVEVLIPNVSIEKLVDYNCDGVFTADEKGIAGKDAIWKVIVTNSGEVLLKDLVLTDSNGHDFSQDAAWSDTLLPGDSFVSTYTATINAETTNTATVSAMTPCGVAVGPKEAKAHVLPVTAEISVEKLVDFNCDGEFTDSEVGVLGEKATWKVIVTNTGGADLKDLVLTDTNAHDFTLDKDWSSDLAAGKSWETTYATTITEETTNTVTASAKTLCNYAVGPAEAKAHVKPVPASLKVEKYVDYNCDGEFSDAENGIVGKDAVWKVIVTNTGDVPLQDLVLTDTNLHDFTLDKDWSSTLPAQGSWETTYATTINDKTTNTVSASAKTPCGLAIGPETASATATPLTATIAIDKTVDFNNDGIFTKLEEGTANTEATWKVVVTNSGEADLKDIVLTDTNGHNFTLDAEWKSALASGESMTFTYKTVITAAITNTATVEAKTLCNYAVGPAESAASVTVKLEGPTRTVGFWQTHACYTAYLFEGALGGSMDLGWITATTSDTVLAVLNSNNPKVYKPTKFTNLENKRLDATRQLAAAILNEDGLGTMAPKVDWMGTPTSIIEVAREILGDSGSSIADIVWIGGLLQDYNVGGDLISLPDAKPSCWNSTDGYLKAAQLGWPTVLAALLAL